MHSPKILSFVCEKNGVSYIVFSQDFKILNFSKNITNLADNTKSMQIGSRIQDAFWEFLGLETSILELLKMKTQSLKIPMIYKKSQYYDIEVEVFNDEGEDVFIAHIARKTESSLRYLQTIQDINKRTLYLQNRDTKEIKKNYYELLNERLVSFQVDMQGLITEANQVCSVFLDKPKEEIVGTHFSKFFHTRASTLKNDHEKIFNALNKLGQEVFFHADIIPVKKNSEVSEYIIICQDITYLKHIERELEYAALHDSLTGLANRTLLLKKIDEAILKSQEDKTIFGVCFIDLDKFKLANDTYGHHAGDMLLKHISTLLSHFVREHDIVARIGGDEFVILFQNVQNAAYLHTAVERIKKLPLENPLHYTQEDTISFGFSLGLSIYPDDAKSAAELLSCADKAMYKDKKSNHSRV